MTHLSNVELVTLVLGVFAAALMYGVGFARAFGGKK